MSAVRFRLLLLSLFSLAFVDGSPSSVASNEETTTTKPKSPSLAMAKLPVRFEANAGQLGSDARFIARQSGSALLLKDEGATLSVRTDKPEKTKQKKRGAKHANASSDHVAEAPKRATIKMTVANGRTVTPVPSEMLVTKVNYLLGKDRSKWHTNIPTYGKITYPGVLDGVDLVYHGENGALEYDFVVAPGTSVDGIAMNVDGAASMSLTSTGDLAIHTDGGDIVQPRPVVFQYDEHGVKQVRTSSYRIVDKNKIGFEVASYDRSKPLVIDPVLAFATYFGGDGNEEGKGVAGDASGSTYITGNTTSLADTFPETVNAYQKVLNGAGNNLCQGPCSDAFVAKIDPSGTALVYATYFGGGGTEESYGIAVNPTTNEAFIAGYTDSPDFPTTGVAGGFGVDKGFGNDTFVARFNSDGSGIGYSKLPLNVNGIGNDAAYAIAVDAAGRAYITGEVTTQILEAAPPGGGGVGGGVPAAGPEGQIGQNSTLYALRLLADGSNFDGNPFGIGGDGQDVGQGIAIDASGNAYVTGYTTSTNFPVVNQPLSLGCHNVNTQQGDAVVIKISSAFASNAPAAWAVCLAGTGDDYGYGIAVNPLGEVAVVGSTTSGSFPIVAAPTTTVFQDELNGFGDAFITKLDNNATPVFSTYFGGNQFESAQSVAFDSGNALWVTGYTSSTTNFPITPTAPQPNIGNAFGEPEDAFVSWVKGDGASVLFSTYYGGADGFDQGNSVSVSGGGTSVHLAGTTNSTNLFVFSTTNGAIGPALQPALSRPDPEFQPSDAWGARISVAPLLLSPPSVTLAPGQGQTFTAFGGAGFGFVYSFFANQSGATINPSTGDYVAGAAGGVTDIVQVVDFSGQKATATVIVGQATTQLIISPASTTLPPKGLRTFTASGGLPPYQFSFVSNASNGQISPQGNYTAGAKGNVVDVVRVTDSAGAQATATITVGPAITIQPGKPITPPKGTIAFSATGGSGTGYVWAMAQAASGGNVVANTGLYTAGDAPSAVDVVRVTDSLGNTATVAVSVGGALAITPSDPTTTTRGAIPFEAFGGNGEYTWTIQQNLSKGTINKDTGAYVAGDVGNVQDIVRCTDSLGNNSAVTVSVGPSLTITPNVTSVAATGKVTFTAAGGSGTGYIYSIPTNASGSNVGATTGLYTAGGNGGVDTVRLTDSLGATADATVTVAAPPPPPPPPGSSSGGVDAGTIPGINLGGGGNDDCSCRAVGTGSVNAGTDGARVLAGLALALGLVWRRRRRAS